jgi:hypothetical protein
VTTGFVEDALSGSRCDASGRSGRLDESESGYVMTDRDLGLRFRGRLLHNHVRFGHLSLGDTHA